MADKRPGTGRKPRRSPMRVVAPDEKAPPAKRYTVTEAAAEGTVRDLLVATRDRVAKDVEDPNCPSRDLAALSRRLIELTKEIAAIDARDNEESDGVAATPDEDWEAV